MPFARPTLTALRNQAIEDITTSGVPNLDGLLRNAVLRVLAWVMSGLAYSVYGYADWIAKEGVPFTATDEYLRAWAALVGIYPKDSTPATGQAQFTGNTGTVLPLGSTLVRQDGTPYETTTEASVDSTGTVTVAILALVSGAGTNAADGTPISLSPPIVGLNGSGVCWGPLTGGADQETDDQLRTRMLERYREPPQGGAALDYIEWALQVPGVTRAWALRNGAGTGTVVVYPMFDDANAAIGGFPLGTDGCATDEVRGPTAAGDQLTVADHIYPLQPVTALVYVAAPIAYPIDVVLAALDPNTEDTIAIITAALQDMLLSVGEVGGIVYPSQLYEAILAVPGINHFVIASPNTVINLPMGELPTLGTVTVSGARA